MGVPGREEAPITAGDREKKETVGKYDTYSAKETRRGGELTRDGEPPLHFLTKNIT